MRSAFPHFIDKTLLFTRFWTLPELFFFLNIT